MYILATPSQKVSAYTKLVAINFPRRNSSDHKPTNRASRASIRNLIRTIRFYQQQV